MFIIVQAENNPVADQQDNRQINCAYSHNGILHGNKNKPLATSKNVDDFGHYVQWKKTDTKEYTLYYSM